MAAAQIAGAVLSSNGSLTSARRTSMPPRRQYERVRVPKAQVLEGFDVFSEVFNLLLSEVFGVAVRVVFVIDSDHILDR